jgi:hypothetical protein
MRILDWNGEFADFRLMKKLTITTSMKTNLLKAVLLACCVVAGGFNLPATQLQRADVAANSVWVLHVNCDTLRPTAIGKYILAELEKPEAQAKLAVFQDMFSFDLRTQLHGLTLYSGGSTPQDGVLLVYADFDQDKLVTLAKAANDSKSTTHNGHTIYNWVDDNKKAHHGEKQRVYASIQGNRIIFGQREAAVSQALDVLDGSIPNLSTGSAFPHLGAASDTSFLFGAARKIDFSQSDPNAAIFRLSKGIRLQIGEVQQHLIGTLTLEANDEEVAGSMTAIAQGMIGLLKLQKDKPEVAKFLQAINLKQDGSSLVLGLNMATDDVVGAMKASAERKAARKAEKAETEEKK